MAHEAPLGSVQQAWVKLSARTNGLGDALPNPTYSHHPAGAAGAGMKLLGVPKGNFKKAVRWAGGGFVAGCCGHVVKSKTCPACPQLDQARLACGQFPDALLAELVRVGRGKSLDLSRAPSTASSALAEAHDFATQSLVSTPLTRPKNISKKTSFNVKFSIRFSYT